MKTGFLKLNWILVVMVGLFIASCSKETDTTSTSTEAEEYAEEVVSRNLEGGNLGRLGCYELVFPVTVDFPNGAESVEVNSFEEMVSAIKAWKESTNPDRRTRPSIAFPFDVLNKDGELITVEDETQLRELKVACKKDKFHGGAGNHGNHHACFKIDYPFTLILPDSTEYTLNSGEDKAGLRDALKAWEKANPGVKARPELKFPITVTMADGTSVTVNSKEELKTLKESCE
ncbi:MAG: hypothetical protein R2774_01385 [Saprospiraceae bacterium]